MALIALRPGRDLHPRMQVERHFEFRHCGPERAVLGNVVVDGRIRHVLLRKTVDHGALEPQFADAARQFRRSGVGVLHGQRREAPKAVRMPGHGLGDGVIALLRHADRLLGVQDALNAGRIEGQQCELDAGLVHGVETSGTDIKYLHGEVVPATGVAGEAARLRQRLRDRHVFLERNFSLHR